jgi:erythromycin esterase
MIRHAATIACFAIAASSAYAPAQQPYPQRPESVGVGDPTIGRDAFVEWAKHSLSPLTTVVPGPPWRDLEPLGKMVGDADVVALSEAPHQIAEPLEFRNRVFQYLVEEKGFTAIAIESGLVEGRTVHDYVRGGGGDFATVLSQGIGWNWDQLPQNQSLVQWIRRYNADPRHARKVNFYGFDVPGSPGDLRANRGLDTALITALAYLSSVDSGAATFLHVRIDPFLANIRSNSPSASDGAGYSRLTQSDRDALSAGIADLITLLERREAQYNRASSAADYQWGYRAAIAARQVDEWLRQTPAEWRPSSDAIASEGKQAEFEAAAADVKDRAQADNLDWIVRQEGSHGKILVFAARYHLSGTPINTDSTSKIGTGQIPQEVAGTYLRRRFGARLLSIGNLIGGGTVGCADSRRALKSAPADSIGGIAGELGRPLYLLDLRAAPPGVGTWLNQEHPLGQEGIVHSLAIGKAFDVLFYLNTGTPSCGP